MGVLHMRPLGPGSGGVTEVLVGWLNGQGRND